MLLQGTRLSTFKVALVAAEWLLSTVDEHVGLQSTRVCRFVIALAAIEQLFSSVYKHMLLQMTNISRFVVAHFAAMCFVSSKSLLLGLGSIRHDIKFFRWTLPFNAIVDLGLKENRMFLKSISNIYNVVNCVKVKVVLETAHGAIV